MCLRALSPGQAMIRGAFAAGPLAWGRGVMRWLAAWPNWLWLAAVFFCMPAWAEATDACEPEILSIQMAQAPDGSRPVEGWQETVLPDRWAAHWPEYTGAVWYRVDWVRGCRDSAAPPAPVGLAMEWISLAGIVYINDDLLWRDRSLSEPFSRSWNMPRYWRLPESSLHDGVNTLWIGVHGLSSQGGGLGRVHLGEPGALESLQQTKVWHQRTMFIINLAISTVLGCLFFCIWLHDRSQHASGWYVLTAFFWIVFAANMLCTEPWPFLSTLWMARINVVACLLFVCCYCMFTWSFCRLRLRRTAWVLGLLQLGMAFAVLLVPDKWLSPVTQVAILGAAAIFSSSNLLLLGYGLVKRSVEPLVLAISGLLCIAISIHDILLVAELIKSQPLLSYTSLLTMLTLSILLGRRIARNMRRIAQFNQELSSAVSQACDDLSATLAREHALALDNSVLQERLQISRDLHDSLGGSLVRSIAVVEQARTPLDNTRFLSMLKLLRNDLRQVIDSSAQVESAGVHSPQALMAPLRHRFVNLFDELGIASEWSIPSAWRMAPSARVCLALTRLVEEALANVIKHSRARRALITLELPEQDMLVLRIEDDGVGFDVDAVQDAGLSVGMRSMHVRMERIGGSLQVSSRRGHTRLEASLHLHAAGAAEGGATLRTAN